MTNINNNINKNKKNKYRIAKVITPLKNNPREIPSQITKLEEFDNAAEARQVIHNKYGGFKAIFDEQNNNKIHYIIQDKKEGDR